MEEKKIKEKSVKGVDLKTQLEILEANGALTNIVIVHKDIPQDLFDKVYEVKRRANKINKVLNEVREDIKEITKTSDLNAWNAAFLEKWDMELKKEVEFPVTKLSKSEITTLLNANKEQNLTAGHVDLLYNLFKVD